MFCWGGGENQTSPLSPDATEWEMHSAYAQRCQLDSGDMAGPRHQGQPLESYSRQTYTFLPPTLTSSFLISFLAAVPGSATLVLLAPLAGQSCSVLMSCFAAAQAFLQPVLQGTMVVGEQWLSQWHLMEPGSCLLSQPRLTQATQQLVGRMRVAAARSWQVGGKLAYMLPASSPLPRPKLWLGVCVIRV